MSWLQLQPALPELFLVCAAMALLMFGVFRGDRSARFVSWAAVIVLVITAILVATPPPMSMM